MRDFLRLEDSIRWIRDNKDANTASFVSQTMKKQNLNDDNGIQKYGILEIVADEEKNFDYETEYSKNTKD